MKSEDIFSDIKTILMDEFEVEEALITEQSSIYTDLGLDSLDAIDLIVNMSNKYDVDISNESIEEAKTIQQLIDVLQVYIAK